MSAKTYDIALAVGLLMIGGGVAAYSLALAAIVVGTLVIALTIFGAWIARGRR